MKHCCHRDEEATLDTAILLLGPLSEEGRQRVAEDLRRWARWGDKELEISHVATNWPLTEGYLGRIYKDGTCGIIYCDPAYQANQPFVLYEHRRPMTTWERVVRWFRK